MAKSKARNQDHSRAGALIAPDRLINNSAFEPGTLGRILLFVHLILSPLIFWTQTVEQFEYNKVGILLLAAVILGAMGLSTLVWKAATQPANESLAALFLRARWLGREPVALGFLLLAASAIASTATSISPRTSFFGAHESFTGLLTILAYTVLFFATREFCRTLGDGRRLLTASVVGAAVASAYALVQVAQLDPIPWQHVSRRGGYVSPFATMGNPNFLAAFLVMTFPVTAYFTHRAAKQRRWFALGVFILVGILSWLVILLTLSRGAWLALACTVVVFVVGWFCISERRKVVALASLILSAMLVLSTFCVVVPSKQPLFASIVERLRHFIDEQDRWRLWRAAIRIFLENPIFGSGLDTFQLAFQRERTMEFFVAPTKAHNEALHILVTQGFFGAVAFAVLTAGLVLAAYRAWRRTAPSERLFLVVICAGVVGFYVQNLFSFTVAGFGTLFVTFAGLLSRLGGPGPRAEPHTARDSLKPFALGLLLAGVLVALVFVANLGETAAASGPGTVWVCLAVLTALVLVALSALTLERNNRSAAAGEHMRRKTSLPKGGRPRDGMYRRARLLQVCIWAGAALILFQGVLLPIQANRACRKGLELMTRKPQGAVAQLQRAVAIDPTKEFYWVKLGMAAQSSAKSAQGPDERRRFLLLARRAYERSIELVPENALNRADLGRILGALAREGLAAPAEAFTQFDAALMLEKKNAYHYAAAGNTALALGDLARARLYASRGTELYPRFGPTRALLGQIAVRENRFDDAVDDFQQANKLKWYDSHYERAIASLSFGEALTKLQRFREAVRVYRRAVKQSAMYPEYVEAQFRLAAALELLGEHDEAVAEYRRVLTLHPDHERARQALGRLGFKVSRNTSAS